jgi:hypothetical protein
MCIHTSSQPLAGGTDLLMNIREPSGNLRPIVVRGCPALQCTNIQCATILTDLDWMLAAEQALEAKLQAGESLPVAIAFDELHLTAPARLCA